MTEYLCQHSLMMEEFSIPLDWSSASYPMAFGALNHEIFFPGLSFDLLQADAKFLSVLQKLEAIEVKSDGILVKPLRKHLPINLDVSDCLDLVPALLFLLAHVEGQHELTGIQNLAYKESDRLSEGLKLLGLFNRKAVVLGNKLVVKGENTRLTDTKVLTMANDHRMVMTAALFLLHHAGGELSPIEAVEKSYPDFFQTILP